MRNVKLSKNSEMFQTVTEIIIYDEVKIPKQLSYISFRYPN
jgi:hypothetical protein